MILALMVRRNLQFHRSFTKDFSAEEKRSPGFGIRADNRRFRGPERVPSATLAQGLCKRSTNLFSKYPFCLGRILGLFFEDGRVIGLFGLFCSPSIPLAISVENRVLEIVGLDSESGLIMGDSCNVGAHLTSR